MVDLITQYELIKNEIDAAIQECLESASFVKGKQVTQFQEALQRYLGVNNVIGCANGTDALQIALMALDLKPGDEVIVPAFTYVATAEVIGLLGLTPVMVDVDKDTFNITPAIVENAITSKTKLIVPVHLFGQCADMEKILKIATDANSYVIEDNAQSIGADYTCLDGSTHKSGTMGHIGTMSFFPSKNLGCFGDGGAVCTNDEYLANRMRMIANHGQAKQYFHEIIGINSRLDAIQANILNVKLKYLQKYNKARQHAANQYDKAFSGIASIQIPSRLPQSTHVFHQYTIKVPANQRNQLKEYLAHQGIPSMIYYPLPLHRQKAFENMGRTVGDLPVATELCTQVISLPIHTEMDEEQQNFIINAVVSFFS